MITPSQLDTFQQCPLKWKLSRTTPEIDPLSEYSQSIRQVLYKMYGILMANNRYMGLGSVENYWDKMWWQIMNDQATTEKEKENAIAQAAEGWMGIHYYYINTYVDHGKYFPVIANADFDTHLDNISIRSHVDLILATPEKQVSIFQFKSPVSQWQMYNSLSTKAELITVQDQLGEDYVITSINYVDLSSRPKKFPIRSLFPAANDYIKKSRRILEQVGNAMRSDNVYASMSSDCKTCDYKPKCWA